MGRHPHPLWGWAQSRAGGEVTAAALASAKATYDQEFTTAAETNNPLGLFATVAHWGRQPADRARLNPVADAGADDPRDALLGAGAERAGAHPVPGRRGSGRDFVPGRTRF